MPFDISKFKKKSKDKKEDKKEKKKGLSTAPSKNFMKRFESGK